MAAAGAGRACWDVRARARGSLSLCVCEKMEGELALGTRNSTVLDLDIPETEFSRMKPFAHFNINSARRSCHFGVIACVKQRRGGERAVRREWTDHRSFASTTLRCHTEE